MAHFAEIIDGKVVRVIVVSNNDCPDPAPDNEAQGQAFIASLGLPGKWVQTSYSSSFRFNYAGIGWTWDSVAGAFYAPQPFASWILDDSYTWQAPKPYPNNEENYIWDETLLEWVEYESEN